jgi:hypothetical protein
MLTPAEHAPEGQTPCRIGPSSFDPSDPKLTALPLPSGWRWSTLEAALSRFESKFLLSRLPLFWQIESPLDDVCRSVGVTVFHNEVENMPVGAAAIRSAEIDTVLTTSEDAHGFVAYLFEKGVPIPRNWFIIHPGIVHDLPAKLKERSFVVVEEMHDRPGSPKI